MNRRTMCALLVSLAVAGGCASPAKYVEQKGDTGIVSIPSNTDSWPSYHKRAATELIKKHVGIHYEIVEQREVVVGQSTTNNQQVNTEQTPGLFPFLAPNEKQTVTNNTTSHDVTEWRIWYRRVDAPWPAAGEILHTGGAVPQNPLVPDVRPVANGLPPGGPTPRYISGGTGSHLIPSGGGRP